MQSCPSTEENQQLEVKSGLGWKKPTPAMCSEGVPDNRSLPPATRRSSDEVDLVSWTARISIALFRT